MLLETITAAVLLMLPLALAGLLSPQLLPGSPAALIFSCLPPRDLQIYSLLMRCACSRSGPPKPQANEVELGLAATTIQTAARRRLYAIAAAQAATMLQANIRGFLTRLYITDLAVKATFAASFIATCWRGWATRRRLLGASLLRAAELVLSTWKAHQLSIQKGKNERAKRSALKTDARTEPPPLTNPFRPSPITGLTMAACFHTTYCVLLILIPRTLPTADFDAAKVAALRFAIMAHMEELELSFRWATPSGPADVEYYFKITGRYLHVLLNAVRVAVYIPASTSNTNHSVTSFARHYNAYIKWILQEGKVSIPDARIGLPFTQSITRGLHDLQQDPFARLSSSINATGAGQPRARRHGSSANSADSDFDWDAASQGSGYDSPPDGLSPYAAFCSDDDLERM